MKTPSKPKPSFASRRPRLFLSMVAVGFVLVLGLVWLVFDYFGNYAEKTAKPLENALIKAGGTKTFSSGDAGRFSDNTHPYYDAIYDFSLNTSETVTLVNKVAEDNGFKLTHASPTNKGHLGAVADEFIDSWYFDNSSKASAFPDLDEGTVKLGIQIGYDDESGNQQSDHTKVRISIQMPELRR